MLAYLYNERRDTARATKVIEFDFPTRGALQGFYTALVTPTNTEAITKPGH